MLVLITGGGGYIPSHTIVELLQAGFDVIALDNFSNSFKGAAGRGGDASDGRPESLRRVEQLTQKKVQFYECSVRDPEGLRNVFSKHKIDLVIHFAALKAVGESVAKPLEYYQNNISGTCTLMEVMREFAVKNMIFSSSATVYGDPQRLPLDEDHPTGVGITNPYGMSKHFCEIILSDLHRSDNSWNIILLRYFNPVGAHESGLIGEDPAGIPNNLMPYVSQVAVGKLPHVRVFGNDYDTPDGTGVRDYIHVVDCARGHLAAIKALKEGGSLQIYNLGTGRGYSVLEMIAAFSKACGKEVPFVLQERRPGDLATVFCDPAKADKELEWKAEFDLDRMCEDLWRWQSTNPNGFRAK